MGTSSNNVLDKIMTLDKEHNRFVIDYHSLLIKHSFIELIWVNKENEKNNCHHPGIKIYTC